MDICSNTIIFSVNLPSSFSDVSIKIFKIASLYQGTGPAASDVALLLLAYKHIVLFEDNYAITYQIW